jgi:DNA-binding NarL/FixJ family response regulator
MGSTIVIADSVPADRAAFAAALKDSPFRVVSEVNNGDALVEALEKTKAWCAAIDLLVPGHDHRPGDGGIATIKRIAEKYPAVRILVIHSEATAHLVMSGIQAGAGARVKKPYKRDALIESLAKLNSGTQGDTSVKQLAVRLKKTLIVHYKAVDDGYFTKKREGITTDISLTGLGIQTEEKLSKGKVLNIEVDIPGEPQMKAKMQAVRVEPVAGLPRYDVGLHFVEMSPDERERLKNFIKRLIERGTSIMK